MSTLKSINVIHPSGTVNNIVNDASGNVTVGGTITAATHIGGTAASSSLTLQSTSGVGTSDSILFKVGNNGATVAMTVDTSGNVGIGNPTPSAKLDISTGTTATAINSNNGLDTGFVLKYASTLTSLGNNFNQPLAFLTNNTEKMRIDASGNVGIGTTSTGGYRFAVVGSTASSVPLYLNTDATNSFVYSPNSMYVGSTGAYALNLVTNNGVRAIIDSSGNVGIGNNTSAGNTLRYLDLQNSDTGSSAGSIIRLITSNVAASGNTTVDIVKYKTGGFYINNNDTNAAVFTAFNVGTSEAMRIDSSRNVLVGLTTTPTTGTNVTNNLVISNSISDGSLLIGTLGSFLGRQSSDGSTFLNTAQASIIFTRGTYGSTSTSMTIDYSGNVGIGAVANASAILDAQSTTKGVRFPNMTTTQKNAVSSPAAGLVVFDTTLAKLCVYSGSAWQTITSI